VVEIGAAGNWSVNNGSSSLGPNFAVEVTPIEHWLEIEAGVTPLFAAHSTEWDVDCLFKKPWTISKKIEVMVGAGPEWDLHECPRRHDKLRRGQSGARFRVLAPCQAPTRLVPRTGLRLQLRPGTRAIGRDQRRPADRHSMKS